MQGERKRQVIDERLTFRRVGFFVVYSVAL